MEDLEDRITISSYNDLTRGKLPRLLASIPFLEEFYETYIRGAPIIRHLSLEGKTEHGEALRRVLTFEEISNDVEQALKKGEIGFNLTQGFHGEGFDSLDISIQKFLEKWTNEHYKPEYRKYKEELDTHDEIKNYKRVMIGAWNGVVLGAFAGVALGAYSALSESNSCYPEFFTRSLPAILEAEEIARPFYYRLNELIRYKLGKSEDKPKFTSTEIWALTQLAGPLLGFLMLVVGEKTGLNDNPIYRATGIYMLSTGNNIIGAIPSYAHFFREIRRRKRFEDNLSYENSKQRRKDLKGDLYSATQNFWKDSFQSSNAIVVSAWYGIEVSLRYFGIAAEKVGGTIGGNILAGLESALLCFDTFMAAILAIEREKRKLHGKVMEKTKPNYLKKLWNQTNGETNEITYNKL